jgi:hypothetical protein
VLLIDEVVIGATCAISFDRTATITCEVTNRGVHVQLERPTEDIGTRDCTMSATAAHAEVTSPVVYAAPFNHGGP